MKENVDYSWWLAWLMLITKIIVSLNFLRDLYEEYKTLLANMAK